MERKGWMESLLLLSGSLDYSNIHYIVYYNCDGVGSECVGMVRSVFGRNKIEFADVSVFQWEVISEISRFGILEGTTEVHIRSDIVMCASSMFI